MKCKQVTMKQLQKLNLVILVKFLSFLNYEIASSSQFPNENDAESELEYNFRLVRYQPRHVHLAYGSKFLKIYTTIS